MYSVKQLFKQEPAAIKAALTAVLSACIVAGVITVSAETLAAIGVAFELVLGLLWVRQLTVTKDALAQVNASQETARAEGAELARRPVRAPKQPKP